MKVREIMTSEFEAATPQTTVGNLARLMLDKNQAGIPVVDEQGTFVGLVTEDDLVAKHAHPHVPLYLGILGGMIPIETHNWDEEVERVLGVTAQDVMTDHPSSVRPDDDLETAADLMVNKHVDPVVVLEGGKIHGLVSRRDILRLVAVEESDGNGSPNQQ